MRAAVHRRLGVRETRLTVHHAYDGVLENEDALSFREMTPHGNDRELGGGVALLRHFPKDFRTPVVEVTSPASGLEEVVHLGSHHFDYYRVDVDAGLLTYRGHVLSLYCGWFYYERWVRMTLRDAEPHSHDSHFHNVGFLYGSLIELGYMRCLQRLDVHTGSEARMR